METGKVLHTAQSHLDTYTQIQSMR